jgi:hypothetical protein
MKPDLHHLGAATLQIRKEGAGVHLGGPIS